ncbi:MAG TPA: effector-associated domain EAD1-containing protein [Solirubrobacteraceae bacterium]|jgi:hypothetical protein|nr:effector-associated domain EAD1-containing protein [Solirubrobacteraceae bacterium]
MPLTGADRLALRDALGAAFPPARLEQMVSERLDRRLHDLAPPNATHAQMVFKVIEQYEAEDRVPELIAAARDDNPSNAKLQAAAARIGVAVAAPESLERIIDQDDSVDVVPWREMLGALESQVCCIEVPNGGGTGFLVGPQTVMTNHHVVERLLTGAVKPHDVVVRFDFKEGSDGRTVSPGTEATLADGDEWIVDSSPPSAVDIQPDATALPGEAELDYAILKLAEPLGESTIGTGSGDAPARGWVRVPTDAPALKPGRLALILQHPRGEPVKLAADPLLEVNGNGTRVRYLVDTDGGSSGSPVFDLNWKLMAIHHSGDPDYKRSATYNEGVPIDRVRALVIAHGKGDAIR